MDTGPAFALFVVGYNLAVLAAMLMVAWRAPGVLARRIHPLIRAALGPQSREDKVRAAWAALPLLVLMLGAPLGYLVATSVTTAVDYLGLWLLGYVLLQSFNLFDLIVIDGLVLCWWTPPFVVAPGTEGHPAYKDFGHHVKGFFKGCVLLIPVSALLAGVAWLY